jgi:AcrR family transcriptional regulator
MSVMPRHPVEKSRREEYSDATRHGLLESAREIFAAQGFHATSTEAISRAARVTRGAFYHHFEDKTAIFDAVVVVLQAEVARSIEALALDEHDRWKRLRVGIDAYLGACAEPAYRRLVIQEAPAVLGNKRFREIDEAYPLGLLITSLRALKLKEELDCDDPGLLGRMVGAMICEVALLLPDAKDATKLRKQALDAVTRILNAFRRETFESKPVQ